MLPAIVIAIAVACDLLDVPGIGIALLSIVLLAVSWQRWKQLTALSEWSEDPVNRAPDRIGGNWSAAMVRLRRLMRRQQATQAEAERQMKRLQSAVDLMPDALIALDTGNQVQWFNAAAAQQFRLLKPRRPLDHFIRLPEVNEFLARRQYDRALTIQPDGRGGRMLAMRLVPAPDGTHLLIMRDVTESSRLDMMRRDFVANVSHEIRTPLTVVSGFIETLIDLDLDLPRSDALAYLQMARRNAQTMQRLLTDLLTLSTLEYSESTEDEEVFAMARMLPSWVCDAANLSAGRHDIAIDRMEPCALHAVRSEIETAVRNLLTNAIRYTPDGGRIRASWTRTAGGGAELAIEDTGIGIPAEHLPRIAERFYRVDRSRSRDTGGTGLGLAIVKHIAQRHGARLQVRSTPGEGSRFSLVFDTDRIVADPDAVEPAVPVTAVTPSDAPAGQASTAPDSSV